MEYSILCRNKYNSEPFSQERLASVLCYYIIIESYIKTRGVTIILKFKLILTLKKKLMRHTNIKTS